MSPFECLARLSPGDVIETDIGGERVRVIVIRILYPPEIPSEVGMYCMFQFLDADDESDDPAEDMTALHLNSEGFLFVGVENGCEYLEVLTGADERRAVLEFAKMTLTVKTRHVTSGEDPLKVYNGLWLVEADDRWTSCTRADNITYGDNDVAAVFIAARPDKNGFTVFVMFAVHSEDPMIFCPMDETDRTIVYAKFVNELYGTEAEALAREERGEITDYVH